MSDNLSHTRPAERVQAALSEGLTAFWVAVAATFPEATTGDLPPDVANELEEVAEHAISVWASYNVEEG